MQHLNILEKPGFFASRAETRFLTRRILVAGFARIQGVENGKSPKSCDIGCEMSSADRMLCQSLCQSNGAVRRTKRERPWTLFFI